MSTERAEVDNVYRPKCYWCTGFYMNKYGNIDAHGFMDPKAIWPLLTSSCFSEVSVERSGEDYYTVKLEFAGSSFTNKSAVTDKKYVALLNLYRKNGGYHDHNEVHSELFRILCLNFVQDAKR